MNGLAKPHEGLVKLAEREEGAGEPGEYQDDFRRRETIEPVEEGEGGSGAMQPTAGITDKRQPDLRVVIFIN